MYSFEEGERIALEMRKALWLASVQHLDMLTCIVHAIKSPCFALRRYTRSADRKIVGVNEALYDGINETLILDTQTFRSMNRGDGRARFTVGHELTHAYLGHDGIRHRRHVPMAYERENAEIAAHERAANAVAPAFLAPESMIPENADVEYIAVRFGLSYQAAEIRLNEVQRFRRKKSGQLRPLPEFARKFLNDAAANGHKLKDPSLLETSGRNAGDKSKEEPKVQGRRFSHTDPGNQLRDESGDEQNDKPFRR